MNDRIKVSIENGVADVRLNRPDKMNALDPAMFEAIAETGVRLKDDSSVRAVVLSGEGKAFCAGLDVERLMAAARGESILPFADLGKRTHGVANFRPAHRLALAKTSGASHRRRARHRLRRRLSTRARRGSSLCRARHAAGRHRDQMGSGAGYGGNPVDAPSRARRCGSRTDLHGTDFFRRGRACLRVRHAAGVRSPRGSHGDGQRDRKPQPRRDPCRQAAAQPGGRI